MVYIRRFYQKVQIRQTNPYLLLATALYVSTKIEECPQHIKVVLSAARSIWPGLNMVRSMRMSADQGAGYIQPDVAKLGECEFRLVSEMNAQLIVYHPYRYLVQMQGQLELSADAMTTAWKVVNDHYLTDLLFRIPPPVIAAIAIVLTVIPGSHRAGAEENTRQDSQEDDADPEAKADTRQEADQAEASVQVSDRLQSWLGSSEYDVETVMEGVQQMISLYVIWEGSPQSDDQCKEQIARFIRGRLEAWAGNM